MSPSELARLSPLAPMMAQLLCNRGITDPSEAQSFLSAGHFEPNPFRMKGITEAVTRLRRAIRDSELVAVFGDFDADGITATALLVQALRAVGAKVRPYIPHRMEEGYGLRLDALRDLYRKGVRVLVTVDCGIRAVSQIEQARRGLDIIVTDHHRIGPQLPSALAVINPRQPGCGYPFKELSGAGVAFQLARALLRANSKSRARKAIALEEEDLLDLVALGTVADVVPLVGENRALVKRGLEILNRSPRPGVQALMKAAKLQPGHITARTNAFVLAPRLNAAGRLDSASLSYELLCSASLQEAQPLAERLERINADRRRLTQEILEQARQRVMTEPLPPLLFAAQKGFHPGVVGLVASRLAEEFYRPAVVVEEEEEFSRGSARSIPEFHIGRALDECAELLERHGGHRAAGGFTARSENLPALEERLLAIAQREFEGVELVPELDIDLEVDCAQVGVDTIELLQQLEPFGQGNPRPLFLSREVETRGVRVAGQEGRHLQMVLAAGQEERHAIGFGLGELAGRVGDRVDIVYMIEINEWNGQRRLQFNVQDLRASE